MRWLDAILVMTVLVAMASIAPLSAQVGVDAHQIINTEEGGFDDELSTYSVFGYATCAVGDVDGDGIVDLAVGDRQDRSLATDLGAVWVLFLNDDGTVREHTKIPEEDGELHEVLDRFDRFGSSLAPLGDLDGDGVPDLAVGVRSFSGDEDFAIGAVIILFLSGDGTVSDFQLINQTDGDFLGDLDFGDRFGETVANIGDLDDDGVVDLAVLAFHDDDGGDNYGAIWFLFLNDDGTVKEEQKLSADEWDLDVDYPTGVGFGLRLEPLGDLDGDGIPDLAVSATNTDDGDEKGTGAVWILFLTEEGGVNDHQIISASDGDFEGTLRSRHRFGSGLAYVGDLDGDDKPELVVGARGDPSLWILTLNDDGTVDGQIQIDEDDGNFSGSMERSSFGSSITNLGDLDGDGLTDLAIGDPSRRNPDDDGKDLQTIWILFLGFPTLRGDVDGDGDVVPLADALFLLRYAFSRGDRPPCLDAADADDNGEVSALRDAIYLLVYGFTDGSAPPDPGPEECGYDPTLDDVRCATETCE